MGDVVESVEKTPSETFRESVVIDSTKYLGEAPSELSVDLAIEQYRDCRSYPASWTEDKIVADMQTAKAKIAMAVAEIEARNGAEHEISHSEGGVNRSYGDNPLPMAYASVIPFANVI